VDGKPGRKIDERPLFNQVANKAVALEVRWREVEGGRTDSEVGVSVRRGSKMAEY
jgi:hypothetical protein